MNANRSVLGDIRIDIDDVISQDAVARMLVVNIDAGSEFADANRGPLGLVRGLEPISVVASPISGLAEILAGTLPSESVLLTNLGLDELRAVGPLLPYGPRLLGYRTEIGYWLLLGPAAAIAPPRAWHAPQSKPAFA